jgi:hypothetical protein
MVRTVDQKKCLAKRMGEIYSETMNSNINRLSVAIRELGDGGLWRCGPEAALFSGTAAEAYRLPL